MGPGEASLGCRLGRGAPLAPLRRVLCLRRSCLGLIMLERLLGREAHFPSAVASCALGCAAHSWPVLFPRDIDIDMSERLA